MKSGSIHVIGGCGSSGTTLLAYLLDNAHSDVWVGPESNVFCHPSLYGDGDFKRRLFAAFRGDTPRVYVPLGDYKFPLDPGPFLRVPSYHGLTVDDEYDCFASANSIADVGVQIREKIRAEHSLPESFMWVDQTPKNALTAVGFLKAFPGSTFVHLLRDGRDVAWSLARRYSRELFGGAMAASPSAFLPIGAARWAYDVSAAIKARGMPGYLEIRYEDLVADPLRVINTILTEHFRRPAIDEAYLNADRTHHKSPPAWNIFMGGSKPSWGTQPGKGVDKARVGSWRREGPAAEIEALADHRFEVFGSVEGQREFSFGAVLEAAGYAGR